jgi:hypothetical protein
MAAASALPTVASSGFGTDTAMMGRLGPLATDPLLGEASLYGDGLLAQRVLDPGQEMPTPTDQDTPKELTHKNPWLAMGLSAALPGAGQFYLDRTSLLSFVYVGVEALAWYLNVTWDQDGDDKTREFEEFAWQGVVAEDAGAPRNEILEEEGHWSWARWREVYRGEVDPPPGCELFFDIFNYEEVDSTLVYFWFENQHEFYEDIGKYDKYGCGWANPADRDTYRAMRTEANNLLNRSRNMRSVILVNHLASSVHAFFQARRHNARVEEQRNDLRLHFTPEREGGMRANLLFSRSF